MNFNWTEPGLLSHLFFFEKMRKNNNKNVVRKKNHFFRNLILIFLAISITSGIFFTIKYFFTSFNQNKITINTIKESWEKFDYEAVYQNGKIFLQEEPFNNTVLTYYGYACFYLAVSQNDTFKAQEYLDECINKLRVAAYSANPSLLPQLYYMLGKAYFYKNNISTYYYADLSIKYLTLAKEKGYQADDIAEYLGLSYASLDMTLESISAFTEALLVRESDRLLLSIAEQYFKIKEYNAAIQYLFRVLESSENIDIIDKTKILLSKIYIEQDNLDAAFTELTSLLEKNDNNADAHFYIGIIYEKQNNLVKARSEWRKTLKIQPNYQEALKKLSN